MDADVTWSHRLLALSLLAMTLVSAYIAVDELWVGKFQFYRDNIDQLASRLERLNNLIAQQPALEERLQLLRQNAAFEEYYLAQQTPTLAATGLQQQVRSAVESHGGTLVSTQILPVQASGAFDRVAIRVQMTGDIEALQKMLYTLESQKPLLFIDDLQIRSRQIRQPNPSNPREVQQLTQLVTQFELAGYMRR